MVDITYEPGLYRLQDGNVLVVTAAGELRVETGGKVTANGTQASAVTDAKTNYTTGDLDTEAKIIAAFNATNTKINAILAALRGVGVIASS